MNFDARQIRMIALMLAAVVAILAILWFAVLRTNYVPAYQNIRQSDASAIVAELDTAGIPYRLANDGHDILVPEDQESEARVAVAGSNVAIGGTVGFELFNDSDMGLTEFAQKINFQRAMQGELSRTIMMMGGVEFARVHLAIPERSIFRAADEAPTAAVTLEMRPGVPLTPQRVAGVQQLVASSVPGLTNGDVAILNKDGDLVSAAAPVSGPTALAPSSERGALEAFYAIKARRAISDVLPGLRFEVELTARPNIADPADGEAGEDGVATTEAVRGTPDRADLTLGVVVRTPQSIGPEERSAMEGALTDSLSLSEARGDSVSFTTGALAQSIPAADPVGAAPVVSTPQTASQSGEWTWSEGAADFFDTRTILIGLALLALIALLVWPRRRLAKEEVESFADLLKSSAQERNGASRV